jgi:hypothetical protein
MHNSGGKANIQSILIIIIAWMIAIAILVLAIEKIKFL